MSIKNNTTNLQNLLEQVNNLPEATGGSGGVEIETYTGTVYGYGALGEIPDRHFLYTDETLSFREVVIPSREEMAITVAINTYIIEYNDFDSVDWITDYGSGVLSAEAIGTIIVHIPIQNNFEIW